MAARCDVVVGKVSTTYEYFITANLLLVIPTLFVGFMIFTSAISDGDVPKRSSRQAGTCRSAHLLYLSSGGGKYGAEPRERERVGIRRFYEINRELSRN